MDILCSSNKFLMVVVLNLRKRIISSTMDEVKYTNISLGKSFHEEKKYLSVTNFLLPKVSPNSYLCMFQFP